MPPSTAARDRLVITVLLLASFVVILNETIMSVALPALMGDLRIDANTAQWVSTGFMLTMAVVIPVTGFLQERFTTRAVFLGAMGCFSLGTLVCALAPGFGVLLLGRVIQAGGTATMMPLLMTTILTLVPMERRGQIMGTVSIVMAVAPALGPTISGVILQFLSWRWMFWLVLPIALAILVVGGLRMVNIAETRRHRVDAGSVVLAALGFGGLVYALNQFGEGHAGVVVTVLAVVAVVSLAGFVARQVALQRRDAALLDLRVFGFRNFTLAVVVMMIGFASLLGGAILWPLYLQQVRGLNTVTTGLLLLPGGLAMGLLGPLVGRLYDRFGARPLVVPGAAVVALGLFWMGTATAATPLPVLLLMHVTMNLALSFMFTPCFTHGLNELPARFYAHGSAAIGTLQQVGGAAGTALLISVMSARSASLAAGGLAAPLALGQGLRLSFWLAAALALGAVVAAAFFTRVRPAKRPEN